MEKNGMSIALFYKEILIHEKSDAICIMIQGKFAQAFALPISLPL